MKIQFTIGKLREGMVSRNGIKAVQVWQVCAVNIKKTLLHMSDSMIRLPGFKRSFVPDTDLVRKVPGRLD
jgi:hypothetical protein